MQPAMIDHYIYTSPETFFFAVGFVWWRRIACTVESDESPLLAVAHRHMDISIMAS